jgi:hypothetical protein
MTLLMLGALALVYRDERNSPNKFVFKWYTWQNHVCLSWKKYPEKPEAGFLVRVHPDPCLILIRAQIRALLCAPKSKFIRAQTLTLPVLDKKTGLWAVLLYRIKLVRTVWTVWTVNFSNRIRKNLVKSADLHIFSAILTKRKDKLSMNIWWFSPLRRRICGALLALVKGKSKRW